MTACMAAYLFNDTAMKFASADITLPQALVLRGLITVVVIAAIAHYRGQLLIRLPRRDYRFVWLRVLGEVGATVCFLTALFHLPLANATAIMQAIPLAVTLGAAVCLGEAVGWRRWSAIAIGFAGVMIIVRPGTDGFNHYSLLALASVAFVALRDLATSRLPHGVPSLHVALITAVAITVLGGGMLPLVGWVPITPALALLMLVAALCVVAGYLFSIMTMRVGEVSFVSSFRYTALIWGIVLGVVVFGDIPDGWTLVGSVIVVATGLYSFQRERVRARQAAAQLDGEPPRG